MILSRLKTVLTFLILASVFSCSKEEKNLTNLDETIFVRYKKADMAAHIHGNASEKVFLIMLHGGPGGYGLQYRVNTIKSEIEKNNAVVYFDQRGSGNSQGNFAKEDVNIDIVAEDVLALAKVIRSKYGKDAKLFLMGHSWGGTLGTATLLQNQNEFSGWINVDGNHDPKGSYNGYKVALIAKANEQIALGNSVEFWQNLIKETNSTAPNYNQTDFGKLNKKAHGLEKTLANDGIINKPKANDTDYKSLVATWNAKNIASILANKVFEQLSFTDRLAEITIPSLVLFGKHDVIVPVKYAQEAYDGLGATDKELYIFEKSAHSPMFTEPELFAQKVINFINAHK